MINVVSAEPKAGWRGSAGDLFKMLHCRRQFYLTHGPDKRALTPAVVLRCHAPSNDESRLMADGLYRSVVQESVTRIVTLILKVEV